MVRLLEEDGRQPDRWPTSWAAAGVSLVRAHLLGFCEDRPGNGRPPLLAAGQVMACLLVMGCLALMPLLASAGTGLAITCLLFWRPARREPASSRMVAVWRPARREPASSRMVAVALTRALLLGVGGSRPGEVPSLPAVAGVAIAYLLCCQPACQRSVPSVGSRTGDDPPPRGWRPPAFAPPPLRAAVSLALARLLEDGGSRPGKGLLPG